jgi:hypothetical protein
MDLDELTAVIAGSILGGLLARSPAPIVQGDIFIAVKTAKKLWEEVLRQEKEDRGK